MRHYTYVTGLLLPVFALAVLLLLVVAPAASAHFSKIKAELRDGQLRVEGEGEASGATIIVLDGALVEVARGQADDNGRFRIEEGGVTSPTCVGNDVTVTIVHGPSNDRHSLMKTACTRCRWRDHVRDGHRTGRVGSAP